MSDVLKGNDYVLASAKGGSLYEVSEKGEVLTEIYVPPGKHRASRFMVGLGRRNLLTPGPDVTCYAPDRLTYPITFGAMAFETAASQTFRVDRAEREKRRNDRLERRLDAQQRRQMLLERALERSRGSDPDVKSDPKPDVDPDAKSDVKPE